MYSEARAARDWLRRRWARALPRTLEYTGEYGTEIVCFLPFIYWLHLKGLLRRRIVLTYRGMRPYYYFVEPDRLAEKEERRTFVPNGYRLRYLPNPVEHTATKTNREIYPNISSIYGNKVIFSDKPLLIVLNKYCNEWGLGPINFIAIEVLNEIFDRFSDSYQVVYMREGQAGVDLEQLGYSADHNKSFRFDDDALLRRHPEVISFQELVRHCEPKYSYNELKLMLFSDCQHFISSQGGGNYLATLMPGKVLLIMHRSGKEVRHAYVRGFYQYAANPSPTLLVARKNHELLDALPIFDGARSQQEIESDPSLSSLIQSLDPRRLHDPDHKPALPAEW